LARPVAEPQQKEPEKRLTVTKEEDDFEADFALKIPKKEISYEEQDSNSSAYDQSLKALQAENEMSLRVDIMKDIIAENKSSEHIEEIKLR
jgi:hypothetical protein